MSHRCIVVLGGTFDPVHNGHVALADYFVRLLAPDELRIVPAGNPWQKDALRASPQQRVDMAQQAFDLKNIQISIDQQEIQRHTVTYTIDTLRAIRAETGPHASIVFLLGGDQLQQLDSWREWQALFGLAHICAASRPGFAIDTDHLPPAVASAFARRAGTPEQIRAAPHGLTYLASNLAIDISATAIRAALQRGEQPQALVPKPVLDYIKQHHLYLK